MTQLQMVAHIVYALVLGGLLGWQREYWGKSAGPRTYALVAGGSALFTILSLHAFGEEVGRVASQVVVGIGFLGAGTILHKENRIEGLTTAAGLWVAAGIGMAIGVQYYILAVAVCVLSLIIFMLDDAKFKRSEKDNKDISK